MPGWKWQVIALIGLQVVIMVVGFGLMLAAILHSGPAGIALAMFGYGSVALADWLSKSDLAQRNPLFPFPVIGLVGVLLPVIAVFLAPMPWRLIGVAGYGILGLEPFVYRAARARLERVLEEQRDEEPSDEEPSDEERSEGK